METSTALGITVILMAMAMATVSYHLNTDISLLQ